MVSAGYTVLDFGRVAEAQAKLRQAGTTRVWGSALGSFDSVDSDGARTGYDYNSWGGAVGVDHAFTSRTVLGVAFGCSWGENEAEKDNGYYSAGSIDQDATMIGLYGTHKFRTKGLMNDMKLSAFAAYGQFENSSSRTGLKSGHNATAEWDSDAWVLSASLSRDITTDSGLVVTPYVGVEYTKAGMDDFTEKGKSYNATYTADEDYSNLAVKVGVSVSKTIGSFTPYAGIAYINDVARDTPKVTASGKRTITGEASMPGRSAVQLNLGTGVKLSDSWDAYAGYTAELRSKATEHNVNVGVGYTF
jgi:outer membrane autotransporter protein